VVRFSFVGSSIDTKETPDIGDFGIKMLRTFIKRMLACKGRDGFRNVTLLRGPRRVLTGKWKKKSDIKM